MVVIIIILLTNINNFNEIICVINYILILKVLEKQIQKLFIKLIIVIKVQSYYYLEKLLESFSPHLKFIRSLFIFKLFQIYYLAYICNLKILYIINI